MYLAKKDDDPDKVRPPQRGNDERSIGQKKKNLSNLLLLRSGMASPTLAPSLLEGGTYLPAVETPPGWTRSTALGAASAPLSSGLSPVGLDRDS